MSERIEVAQDALRSIAESLDGITHAFHNAPQYEWKILPAGSYLWSLHEGERTRREDAISIRVVGTVMWVLTESGAMKQIGRELRLSLGGTS